MPTKRLFDSHPVPKTMLKAVFYPDKVKWVQGWEQSVVRFLIECSHTLPDGKLARIEVEVVSSRGEISDKRVLKERFYLEGKLRALVEAYEYEETL